MYGSNAYGGFTYGAEQAGTAVIAPPLITNAFTVYAPIVQADVGVAVPLITNAFQVFPPASIEIRGRPLAEDIRIMRVRRAE